MNERQIRIFVPPDLDENCWVETVVGRIIQPLARQFSPDWIWFSRYEEGLDGSSQDSDLSKIPASFATNGFYRSVRFRYCVPTAIRAQFEEEASARIKDAGFKASGFLDYSSIIDLGGDRFLAEPRTEERRRRRADLIVNFLNASAELFIDALSGPDEQGRYHVEHNSGASFGSSLGVVRHLYCNMTNAPTPVFLDTDGKVQPHPSGEVQILVVRNPPSLQT